MSDVQTTFKVEGSASIAEYLRFKPDAVQKICGTAKQLESIKKHPEISKHLGKLKTEERPSSGDSSVFAEVKIQASNQERLIKLCSSTTHDKILLLDQITDPRNLGAIVRTAAFYGVSKIIVGEHRQAPINQAAVSTAQGGFALCEVFVVKNLVRVSEELKEHGYWLVGTDMGGQDIDKVRRDYEKMIIVLGSEGEGISHLLSKKCDLMVAIKSSKATLESLNVSVAAGVILHAFSRP